MEQTYNITISIPFGDTVLYKMSCVGNFANVSSVVANYQGMIERATAYHHSLMEAAATLRSVDALKQFIFDGRRHDKALETIVRLWNLSKIPESLPTVLQQNSPKATLNLDRKEWAVNHQESLSKEVHEDVTIIQAFSSSSFSPHKTPEDDDNLWPPLSAHDITPSKTKRINHQVLSR
jgi:hypothetical protein